MEVSQQLRCFSSKPSPPSFPAAERTSITASFSTGAPTTTTRRRGPSLTGVKTEFRDLGHLEYYHTPKPKPRFCVTAKKKNNDKETKNKENNKNKLKLLKALSQNLSIFSDISQDDHVSEAADVLLKQLEKLRAEEEELKESRKQDKAKAKVKAEQMATMIHDDSSSSSSSESTESSDSDCGEVIDMNRLRSQPAQHYDDSQSAAAQVAAVLAASLPSLPTTNATEEQRGSKDVTSLQLQKHDKESECRPTTSSCCSKRVEVCMGNKCKKLGGAALMEEFARQMGGEGAVVGCKCMGKCRSAPNVRVMNIASVEEATDNVCVRTTNNNPLCIGVGLEDVSAIVASLLGEDTKDFGLAPAV